MKFRVILLCAFLIVSVPVFFAAPVASGSISWNKSGDYIGGSGINPNGYSCGVDSIIVPGLGIHHEVGIDLEDTAGACIGGQEFWIPNDNNDDALSSEVYISIKDEDVGSGAGINAEKTGGVYEFYDIYKAHGGHNHSTRIDQGFFCTSTNVKVPTNADKLRVVPDGEPVTGMKDCGSGPTPFGVKVDPSHAGAFGTTGTIYANFTST